MRKKKARETQQALVYRLPKDALQKISLGQPHAEHDRIRSDKTLLVRTPAVNAALDGNRSKCFFVGRRGTGKTAITYCLQLERKNVIQLHPEIFNILGEHVDSDDLRNPRDRTFQSLMTCFQRAILDEVLAVWLERKLVAYGQLPRELVSERNFIDDETFDTRVITFIGSLLLDLKNNRVREWVKQKNKAKTIAKAMQEVFDQWGWNEYLLLIDRIDDTWDGTDEAVLLLRSLMHACLEVATSVTFLRPMVYLRENIYERVRKIDSEFSRISACEQSLDWTREMLVEMLERRLQACLNPKPPIGGVWDRLFEQHNGQSSRDLVFDYCQERPRDILTYCTYAIETAQSKLHQIVMVDDLMSARRKFSENRLKDLGDEYSENYPQIQLLLSKFYGLTREYTINAIDGFIKNILTDPDIAYLCKEWIYGYTAPHRFIELLYGIGFFGVKNGSETEFRGSGSLAASPPPISGSSHIVIHPTYAEALNLQDKVLGDIDEDMALKSEGLLLELPDAVDLSEYHTRLGKVLIDLPNTPPGNDHDQEYERIVGEVIRLCFFRVLTNVKPHVRDIDGRVIRDWIASNVASTGFWYAVKEAYRANQIIWECKNYEKLTAGDFQQALYYMNDAIGRFVVMCYRGELKTHYYQHIKRVSSNHKGMLILLSDKDLKTFVRQALNGKVKEAHIQTIYDETIRKVS